MIVYALRKLALAVPTVVIVALIVFSLMHLIPGDPAQALAGDIADPAVVEQIRDEMGLDEPLPVQFAIWAGQVIRGNFGESIITGEPVLDAIRKRFGVTATLVIPALLFSALVAVPAGLLAAWKQNTATDMLTMFAVIVAISVPSFWAGMMLILFFGVWLGWLPTVGYIPIGEDFWRGVAYLIMPISAIMFVEMGSITRMMRSNTIEVLRQDYILHARAKGVPESAVLYRHALKNAFAPTLTLLGLILGSLLGGAAVIETVFSLPGIGRFLVDSIYARDYPVVQGILLTVSGIYILANLLVDLLYPLLDPKVEL
ncbi:MAG TPA: ABC transporter permease [Woeseiaceae bacterium]|nr:ABC transporter permease [Woeseiaceae bacterium]